MIQTANVQSKGIEVADILRAHIRDYQEKYPLLPDQYQIVYDLLNCRTAYLGGHVEQCDHCGNERIAYNSCRNRHCPKCQSLTRERWLEARKAELLPVIYFHSVFTLPHDLNMVIFFNKKMMINILFKSVSETLHLFGKNPQNGLGGKLGLTSILHTWDQLLKPHYHLHSLIPGGALNEDGTSWIKCKNEYLFNTQALGQVFRGKFIDHMTQAFEKGKLVFPGVINPLKRPHKFKELKNKLFTKNWVVYVKPPIKKPEYVLEYLGRYTHRVAISNHRIVTLKDGEVTFKYKNRKTKQMETKTIDAVEFIRRFLLHGLPKRLMRIRHYGFLSNRNKKSNIAKIRQMLGENEPVNMAEKSITEMMLKLTGIDISVCPCCKKGKMRIVSEIPQGTGNSSADIIRPQILQESG